MKFSVLIPVYNAEKYLDECLNSIFSQTYKNFEIILVDDGSTDKSPEISDRYQNDYPEIVKVIHQENQGQLVSRCNAIMEAKSDYCIFMDVDDLIVENALDSLQNSIKKYNLPDMIVYSFYYEYENGEKRCADKLCDDNTLFSVNNKNELLDNFFETTLLNNVWTKCVKTSVLKSIDFDFSPYEELRCAEDRLHSMTMVDKCETIVYIYEPLYRYKIVDGSVTRQYAVEKIERFNDVILYDEQIKYAKKWGLFSKEWLEKFHASIISHLVYVFDLFYMNVNTKDRSLVVEYPWSKFLPYALEIDSIKKNNYLTGTVKKLFYFIIWRQRSMIKCYYLKKKLYQKTRSIKKKYYVSTKGISEC